MQVEKKKKKRKLGPKCTLQKNIGVAISSTADISEFHKVFCCL